MAIQSLVGISSPADGLDVLLPIIVVKIKLWFNAQDAFGFDCCLLRTWEESYEPRPLGRLVDSCRNLC